MDRDVVNALKNALNLGIEDFAEDLSQFGVETSAPTAVQTLRDDPQNDIRSIGSSVETSPMVSITSRPIGSECISYSPDYSTDEVFDRIGLRVIEGAIDTGFRLITKLISKI